MHKLAIVVICLTAACGGKKDNKDNKGSNAPPPGSNAGGTNAGGSGGGSGPATPHHAHHMHVANELKNFQTAMGEKWHQPSGDARMKEICGALAPVESASGEIAKAAAPKGADATKWTNSGKDLWDAIAGIKKACGGTDVAAFDGELDNAHRGFHALLAMSGGHHEGDGTHDHTGGGLGSAAHAAHHARVPEKLAKFQNALGDRWHAPPGQPRMKETCGAIAPLETAAADGGKELVDAVAGLKKACGGTDVAAFDAELDKVHKTFHTALTAAGGHHEGDGTHQHREGVAGGGAHGEHHTATTPELAKFQDALGDKWHAPKGEPRMKDTCAALPAMKTASGEVAKAAAPKGADAAKWTAGNKELGEAIAGLEKACGGKDVAAFDAALEKVHTGYHGLLAASGGHYEGDGTHDHSHAAHHAKISPELAKFEAALEATWHAQKGEPRMKDACGALAKLEAASGDIAKAAAPKGADTAKWTAGGKELSTTVAGMKKACGGKDVAAFDAELDKVHQSFHALLAVSGGHYEGDGTHPHTL